MESQVLPRKPYPTDVSDEEWAFVAPYLTLMREDAPQRHHDLREVFNALRWIVRAGAPTPEPLLEIPAWAFAWQETYRLREPVRLNPGDELYVECHFDNSQPGQGIGGHAPSLPVRDVNWGEGTTDEMCIGNVLAAPVTGGWL